jgi:hypothetical protein
VLVSRFHWHLRSLIFATFEITVIIVTPVDYMYTCTRMTVISPWVFFSSINGQQRQNNSSHSHNPIDWLEFTLKSLFTAKNEIRADRADDFSQTQPAMVMTCFHFACRARSFIHNDAKNWLQEHNDFWSTAPGVDVMIAIFSNFSQFSTKKSGFFLKNQFYDNLMHKLLMFCVKTPIFIAEFFAENV